MDPRQQQTSAALGTRDQGCEDRFVVPNLVRKVRPFFILETSWPTRMSDHRSPPFWGGRSPKARQRSSYQRPPGHRGRLPPLDQARDGIAQRAGLAWKPCRIRQAA